VERLARANVRLGTFISLLRSSKTGLGMTNYDMNTAEASNYGQSKLIIFKAWQ
jgi:hypothetical protein